MDEMERSDRESESHESSFSNRSWIALANQMSVLLYLME